MATGILVDDPNEVRKRREDYPTTATDEHLVGWIMERVDRWREYRDDNYSKKWDEYYRLWRGIWAEEDKTRESERSRLIAPALQQAVEMIVAEEEEATFGQGEWFSVSDDVNDDEKLDMFVTKELLKEDFDKDRVPEAISEAYLNAALYGTGVGKIITEEVIEQIPTKAPDPEFPDITELHFEPKLRVSVRLEPIHPLNFVIDPSAKDIDAALGAAHEQFVPKHKVLEKQNTGVYKMCDLGGADDGPRPTYFSLDPLESNLDDQVFITEYHGKVPKILLQDIDEEEDMTEEEIEAMFDLDNEELVEAIVTIANRSKVLKKVENPFHGDRGIVAFQQDRVPNKFWGRGIAEKGYNAQKALDAELRARIDALALTTHPMMGADATRLPRGSDLSVRPGKLWLTNGDPNQILRPITFGQVSPITFSQSSELERMVQMGTGAMDSASPLSQNRRNETASGMSMIMSGMIKRNKRTMLNIERNFVGPFIKKAARRYMQLYPDRYPVADFQFKTMSTMGLVAREIEQQQFIQLLSLVPPDSPVYPVILKGIYENSSLSNKAELLQALEQQFKPDPQQQKLQQISQQLEIQNRQLENAKLESEGVENMAQAMKYLKEAEIADASIEIDLLKELLDVAAARENIKTSTIGKIMEKAIDAKAKRQQQSGPKPEGSSR